MVGQAPDRGELVSTPLHQNPRDHTNPGAPFRYLLAGIAAANRLPTLAAALELPDFTHHQAEADAITCALIAIELSQRHDLNSVFELWDETNKRRRSYFPARRFTRVSDLPIPNADAHPEHPLHGHHVVITGDLNGFSRDDFLVQVAELGAQPQLNVTKKTTILVVADYDVLPAQYNPMLGTNKEKKAHEYRLAGQQIEVVAGTQALEMLAWELQERLEPVPVSFEEPVDQPVQVSERIDVLESPQKTPPHVDPAWLTLDESVGPPVQQPDRVEIPAREPQSCAPPPPPPSVERRVKHKPRFRISSRIIRPLSWFFVGLSALLVFLFLLGATGAALTNSETSLGIWILAVLIMTPIFAAPALLGWYLLRRYPARK